MYLTEEEAKKKWCPQARMEGDAGGTWNRIESIIKRIFGWSGKYPYPEETCNCIASECMMWRTLGFPFTREYYQKEGIPITHDMIAESERGYCGLGGKP